MALFKRTKYLPDLSKYRSDVLNKCEKGMVDLELVNKLLELTDKKTIIDKFTENYQSQNFNLYEVSTEHDIRDEYVIKISWGIISKDAINEIKQFVGSDTILEIGSGAGFWAAMLKLSGINIIPTDVAPKKCVVSKKKVNKEKRDYGIELWCNVQTIESNKALKRYSNANCLLLCWPYFVSYKASQKFNGDRLIFIGEKNGCTGEIDYNKWKKVQVIDIPQWRGLWDRMYFYTKLKK